MDRQKLFAAQPIYTRDNQIFAYELLYRHDSGLTAFDIGEEVATSELIYNLCTGIAEHVEHFQHPVCINVTADFLLSKAFLPIDPQFVIIELVERIVPDETFIATVQAWVDKGFRFALDDFDFQPEWLPLLKLASIVKVDIEKVTLAEASRYFRQLQLPHLLWLAERVEDEFTYQSYKNLGFHLFQGYFLAKPQMIRGHRVPRGAIEFANIIDHLFRAEPDIDALTAALKSDAALVTKLLRIANSPYYGTAKKIESVKEIILLIGIEPLRKWVLLISCLEASNSAHARFILERAFICSDMAHAHLDKADANRAFLTGLLSGCDLLLGVDKAIFIPQLQIAPEIKEAVLEYQGNLGQLLRQVEDFEFATLMKKPHEYNLSYTKSYQNSSKQVQALMRLVQPRDSE